MDEIIYSTDFLLVLYKLKDWPGSRLVGRMVFSQSPPGRVQKSTFSGFDRNCKRRNFFPTLKSNQLTDVLDVFSTAKKIDKVPDS